MTTDKVRVEIIHSKKFDTILARLIWGKETLTKVTATNDIEISKSRDNWIEITLPEEIDGQKVYNIKIWFDNGWKAEMYPFIADYISELNKIYELRVTTI